MTNRPKRSQLLFAGLCLMASLSTTAVFAADHLDAAGLTPPGGDGSLDINDLYAFRNPADHNKAVLIMTVNPAAGVLSPTTFRTGTSYDFRFDFEDDARVDRVYRVSFGPADAAGQQDVVLRCTPAAACGVGGGAVLARGRTGMNVSGKDGSTLRADLFDDPFFFDLDAFLGTDGRTFCDGGETDFFLGLDVSAIVLQIPRESLPTDIVGVWATTETALDGQVDRMGRPAINTVFIPANPFEPNEDSLKDDFNQSKPQFDPRRFRSEIKDTLAIFYGAGNPTNDVLADILLPDILTVDFSSGAGFLNGRQPADDVIDIELGIVTDSAVTSDCVDNDSAFVSTFPFLAPANSAMATAGMSGISAPATGAAQTEPAAFDVESADTAAVPDSGAMRSRRSVSPRR